MLQKSQYTPLETNPSETETTNQKIDRLIAAIAGERENEEPVYKALAKNGVLYAILSIIFLVIFIFTFDRCKICVLAILITSACLCARSPIMHIVFWPSLIVLLYNVRWLQHAHFTFDVPVDQ